MINGQNLNIVEAAKLVGQKGSVNLEGLVVEVRITDVKQSYGKLRWCVTPIAGGGYKWVEMVEVE